MIVWTQELSFLRLCPVPLGRELYTLYIMHIYINLWLCSLMTLSVIWLICGKDWFAGTLSHRDKNLFSHLDDHGSTETEHKAAAVHLLCRWHNCLLGLGLCLPHDSHVCSQNIMS